VSRETTFADFRFPRLLSSFFLLLAGWIWLVTGAAAGQDASKCAGCHDQSAKIKNTPQADLGCDTCHTDREKYPHPKAAVTSTCRDCHTSQAEQHADSVHGRALKAGNAGAPDCAMCHSSAHEVLRPRSPEFHKAVPDTCGMCHDKISAEFKESIHGKAVADGVPEAPVCTDCHGEHSIQSHQSKDSPVHTSHIQETCGSCHGDVRLSRKFGLPADRVITFEASFHGLAAKAGSQTVANCASCHGVHNIYPSKDKRSTTNTANLQKTCGSCHPGAGQRFALGTVHWTDGSGEPAPVRIARQFYIITIGTVIGLMLLHNGGDWIRKLRRLRLRPVSAIPDGGHPRGKNHVIDVRMYPWERVQHLLLLTSFITLGWTGFALKFPDQWWAWPLVRWETSWPVRGTVHRVASVVFMIAGFLHVISIAVSPRLRRHWQKFIPRLNDIREAVRNTAYNLGFTSKRPRISPYSYIEKAEYWALIWGGIVMLVTGVMLWANNFFLSRVPKVLLDLATAVHFYEAVLACLAIVVWHFYFVIFDPDVYPMDTGWLTGKTVRRHDESQNGEESHSEVELEHASDR
jgi:formate dehydrogenase gamma subunit